MHYCLFVGSKFCFQRTVANHSATMSTLINCGRISLFPSNLELSYITSSPHVNHFTTNFRPAVTPPAASGPWPKVKEGDRSRQRYHYGSAGGSREGGGSGDNELYKLYDRKKYGYTDNHLDDGDVVVGGSGGSNSVGSDGYYHGHAGMMQRTGHSSLLTAVVLVLLVSFLVLK